jgi:predicted PurR-regulated permease PerM
MTWLHNRWLRLVLLMVVVGTTIYFLFLVRDVVYSFLGGGILAYFFYRPVKWAEKRGLKRSWAILALYLLVLGITALVLWLTIPKLIRELNGVAMVLPVYAEQLQAIVDRINGIQWPGQIDEMIREMTDKGENEIYTALHGLMNMMYNLAGKVVIIVFAPIMAFYILKDWEQIKQALENLLSPQFRRELGGLAGQIDRVIIEFSKGYLLISVIIGVLIGLAASLIGVKYALLIGIISAVGELIPYFGPILGGIPAVGLAMLQSPWQAFYMLAAIIIIQQLESNIITPRIIGQKVGMHPLTMVFALLAGGELFGIGGMLIAVPLAAAMKIILHYLYLKVVEP